MAYVKKIYSRCCYMDDHNPPGFGVDIFPADNVNVDKSLYNAELICQPLCVNNVKPIVHLVLWSIERLSRLVSAALQDKGKGRYYNKRSACQSVTRPLQTPGRHQSCGELLGLRASSSITRHGHALRCELQWRGCGFLFPSLFHNHAGVLLGIRCC